MVNGLYSSTCSITHDHLVDINYSSPPHSPGQNSSDAPGMISPVPNDQVLNLPVRSMVTSPVNEGMGTLANTDEGISLMSLPPQQSPVDMQHQSLEASHIMLSIAEQASNRLHPSHLITQGELSTLGSFVTSSEQIATQMSLGEHGMNGEQMSVTTDGTPMHFKQEVI